VTFRWKLKADIEKWDGPDIYGPNTAWRMKMDETPYISKEQLWYVSDFGLGLLKGRAATS
jgi:hypothetical protein